MKHQRLTSKGQITIPQDVREYLKIKPGDALGQDRRHHRAERDSERCRAEAPASGHGRRNERGDSPRALRRTREEAVIGLDTNILVRYLAALDEYIAGAGGPPQQPRRL